METSEAKFVGVDTRKDAIEASVRPTGELLTTDSGEQGMSRIAETLSDIRPALVVMQANGQMELPLAGILVTFGLPVALVQPRSVREFARAIGKGIRPDQGQASLLAQFAEFVRPNAFPLPAELVEELIQLRKRRQEILEIAALERNRVKGTVHTIEKDVLAHTQYLDRSLSLLDAQFMRKVRGSRIWH